MKCHNPIFPRSEGPAGIYLHVPFCLGRCHYCAFVTNPHNEDREAHYIESLVREMELRSIDVPVDTIYFGGGTSSLLPPKDIGRLIQACKARFRVAEQPEITIEINPATVKRQDLLKLQRSGVNRASLGVQSFNDLELSGMGRLHSAADAVTAFQDLRSAGFDNVSVDLVAGYPGQSLESVRKSLQKVTALAPEHVSVYLLELKAGTKLHELVRAGKVQMTDDDLAADLYEEICNLLGEAGFEQYEISNFAREGRQSRHNLKYWDDSIYIGLGSGAHGMTGRARYANPEELEQYEAAVKQNRLPTATATELTPETRFKDALIMGTRLVRGVDLELLGERYQVDAKAFVIDTIGDLSDAGLFVLDGGLLTLTPRGRLLSNVVFARWL
jgi:oxygen-independent coproporphyrinogen III oxidase